MRSPAMTNSEYSKPHLKENAHFTRDAAERRLFIKNENVLLFTSKSTPWQFWNNIV
jgi:hypothetical protein